MARRHALVNFNCAKCGAADVVLAGFSGRRPNEELPTLCLPCSLVELNREAE